MKLTKKKYINGSKNITLKMQHDLEFNASRTIFIKSFLFLFIEVIIPFIMLFFLTSPDLNFSYHFDIKNGIYFGLLTIISIFLITYISFYFNFHKSDQFTYNISLSWMLFGIYLTGYWWEWNKILYRYLFSLFFLLIAIFIGTFITIWIRNINNYLNNKK